MPDLANPRGKASRRKLEELAYWIEKSATRNVRVADVQRYATDAEIDEVISRLRRSWQRDVDAERVLTAASGKSAIGALAVRKLDDGSYLLEPDEGRTRGGAPESVAKEKPKPVTSFGQRVAATVKNVFGL